MLRKYRTCDIIKIRSDTMKKRLYHGSQFIIQKPEYGKGARHNDYGKGFYCTEQIEHTGKMEALQKRQKVI